MTVPNGKVHPAADLFPMISDDELAKLVDDINDKGLLEPGWLLNDGTLLDGRNRKRACEMAGVPMRWKVYTGEDPVAHVISLNMRRRHLDTGQRAMLAIKIEPLLAAQAAERQKAAGAAGAEFGVTGGRGKKKPLVADRPQGVSPAKPKRSPLARDQAGAMVGASGRAVARAKRVAEKAPELAAKVESGELSLDAAEKEVRKTVAKEKALQRQAEWDATANTSGARWQMHHADFRDALADLPDHSVDAIVTDPPYPDEFLPLWADLAKHAARVLRPGAPLIAWSGQFRIQQVLNHLCGPLKYQWMICLDMPGENSRFHATHMIQTWKPIIVCTNDSWGPHEWSKDRVVSPAKDQVLYEWQQNIEPAVEVIQRYVPKGGLVVDPFTGVGSFGVAAMKAGARFIGCELDAGRHAQACERIEAASHD